MKKAQSSNNRKPKASTTGMTAISIRGYKSLYDECRLEIRPLTILAGANSSGKSSAMQPLLLLKQTLEASYDPGALLLNGPNVRFTSIDQLLSMVAGKKNSEEFMIRLEIDNKRYLTNTFKKHPRKHIELAKMEYYDGNISNILQPEMTTKKFIGAGIKPFEAFYANLSNEDKEQVEWRIGRTKCFLNYELRYRGEKIFELPVIDLNDPIERHIREIIHVPGLRGNPERAYKTTAVAFQFPGTFENYVASVVNHWQITEDRRLRNLGNALEALDLTWKVEANQVDGTQVELYVGRLSHGSRSGLKDMVSIADVGFGVSQTLPVLVALLMAEPSQLVYLEQPEIHLHPRAQVALAQVLADAANRGVRVVAETHSSLLLLGVQSLVAEGRLSPEKVKLHWFKRRDNGITEVVSADLDEAGAFGDWPEDFADVDLEAESRYLDAAGLRRGMR